MKTSLITGVRRAIASARLGRERRRDGQAVPRLKSKLEALRDPLDGTPVIKEVFITSEVHSGPYADAAPELLIGYHKGFRIRGTARRAR